MGRDRLVFALAVLGWGTGCLGRGDPTPAAQKMGDQVLSIRVDQATVPMTEREFRGRGVTVALREGPSAVMHSSRVGLAATNRVGDEISLSLSHARSAHGEIGGRFPLSGRSGSEGTGQNRLADAWRLLRLRGRTGDAGVAAGPPARRSVRRHPEANPGGHGPGPARWLLRGDLGGHLPQAGHRRGNWPHPGPRFWGPRRAVGRRSSATKSVLPKILRLVNGELRLRGSSGHQARERRRFSVRSFT